MKFDGSTALEAAMRQYLDDELVEAALAASRTVSTVSVAAVAAVTGYGTAQAVVSSTVAASIPGAAIDASLIRFRKEIAEIASTVLKIPPERMDVRENMSRYGVDSIIVTEIMKCISGLLDLPIAPTVFFEARHLEELAGILFQRYKKKIEKRYLPDLEARKLHAVNAGTIMQVTAAPSGNAMRNDDDGRVDGINAIDASDVENWVNKFKSVTTPGPATSVPEEMDQVGYEPVAIIAMEGVFPNSPDLGAFERHLRNGDDCISEIPADRWDWRKVFGDPKQGEFTNVKFGGFAPDIDKFDPLFFGMSPREAELMDPQHRLFIQCVWKLIESAGYAPKSLSGQKVGIFLGINLQDYAHIIDRAGAMEALHLTSLGHMFCPNRLSFYLDVHGPSQVIDTACSSSLVALHRAVMSIQHEGCEMAIAGGANLIISPDMHIMYSKVGMLCEDGRCKTFSKDANGYVRADGVGAVLLKSLKAAQRDGDTILAVIRGSAENHGGMSTSLTAPNPKAQASLIAEAHRRAGGDPRAIGYIECHGTGTALGDPIEINGLKMAFEQLYQEAGLPTPDAATCGLGSVKSNIGHAETAAGVAGVIKVVLALRNRHLYRSLHSDAINPMIETAQSPFYILQQGRVWDRPVVDGCEQLRRAGVSSFGAGGSNAHVVIEEYIAPPLPAVNNMAPSLILLSAKNAGRLDAVIDDLLQFLTSTPTPAPHLIDIAYTLQVGREAMPERLALIVDSVAALQAKLKQIQATGTGTPPSGCYKGNLKQSRDALRVLNENDALPAEIHQHFANSDIGQLAGWWVQGVAIDWPTLYANTASGGRPPHRIALPSYPFARQRHWLDISGTQYNRHHTSTSDGSDNLHTHLHPLVHKNTSDLTEQRFSAVLSGKEFFLSDHVVMGAKVLPGVAYLEMARAAIRQVCHETERNLAPVHLKNIVWARPFSVSDVPAALHIGLYPEKNGQIAYRIYSQPEGADAESILHSQGIALAEMAAETGAVVIDRIDLNALRERLNGGHLDADHCYDAFNAMSIAYGPGHRCLETVYFSAADKLAGPPQVLAKLMLPPGMESAIGGAGQFVLHPGLIDSGLQACIGLMAGAGHALPGGAGADVARLTASLPFALESLTVLSQPPASMWVWIRYADGSSATDKVQKLDIDFCDEQGHICIRMKGFSSRTQEVKTSPENAETLVCKPVWSREAICQDGGDAGSDQTGIPAWSRHLIVLCDLDGAFPDALEYEIAQRLPDAVFSRLSLTGEIEDSYGTAAVQIFETVKEVLALKEQGPILLQVVIPGRDNGALLGGLTGLLQTASRENAKFHSQLIAMDNIEPVANMAVNIAADSRQTNQTRVRYSPAGREVLHWQESPIAIGTQQQTLPPAMPWKHNGVYLIAGGNGGLGLLFAAQIASQTSHATIVLCARSALDSQQQAQVAHLSAAGSRIEYRHLDVANRREVDELIASVYQDHGRIDGILHCAGLLRDNFIQKKSAAEFAQVLAPKVAGTINLDRATEALDLDFFALFASAAGAWGSAGQADYATANAFLDAFAHHRNALTAAGKRQGHTIAVDWPLWANGGMRMEASAQAMMLQTSGMSALPDADGFEAFSRIVAARESQAMVMHGAPSRIRALLASGGKNPAKTVVKPLPESGTSTSIITSSADIDIDTAALQSRIRQLLLQYIARLMKFALEDLDADAQLSDYGFDSITLTDFANRLNRDYQLELTPTVFFEYPTIVDFAAWLSIEYRDVFVQALSLQPSSPSRPLQTLPSTPAQAEPRTRFTFSADATQTGNLSRTAPEAIQQRQGSDAVAIVGISGRFPMAKDLDAFWDNLLQGKDCISEIPEDRWDWRAIFGDPVTEANKTNIRWGGFIEGIGDFDARFFGISPREAELMDPQQRLLMQYVWKAIEDAGYSPTSLSGSDTALFIGTASSGYGELMAQNGSAIESYSSTGVVGSVGPNRMSYFLNLHGPSEPVETACSSSLVAIHRALAAMAMGDCQQAVVGGINLIVSPETQISFNKAGMLCEDGRCKTFSREANGYVRGEGVGMLFLKKLEAAERDGDHIYGVIRGSAENHGGRGNSLTAPNPKAQAALIKTAYTRAGIDPRSVAYIEAHGTGTELGDPIEINGLKAAFKELYQVSGSPDIPQAHCALGSVKTNIGHLELAAGVAGVIKVLLQLKHKMLVRSLHCETVNPYIQLQGSPFYLLRENREWAPLQDAAGHAWPRRAGISSFGFGGVNAHLVIEEYVPIGAMVADATRDMDGANTPSLIVLSAKNPERLKAYAIELLSFIAGIEGSAAPQADRIRQRLAGHVRSLVAKILHFDSKEISIATPLDELGFDTVYGAALLRKLRHDFDIDLPLSAILGNHSISSFVDAALQNDPALQARLGLEYAGDEVVAGFDQPPSQTTLGNGIDLAALAYTLQVGREAMDQRLALTAASFDELVQKLQAFIEDRTDGVQELYLGQARQNKRILSAFVADDEMQEALEKWMQRGKFAKLLEVWTSGLNIEWDKLYGEARLYAERPRRISAPGYPFAEQRYWIRKAAVVSTPPDTSTDYGVSYAFLHPLAQQNISTLQRLAFKTRLTGQEFFLEDHQVQGQKILPGVAYLEMARAAAVLAQNNVQKQTVVQLRDVVWLSPFISDGARDIDIELIGDGSGNSSSNGAIKFQIVSASAPAIAQPPARQIHSQGTISFVSSPAIIVPPPLNPAMIVAQQGMQSFDPTRCYQLFDTLGLAYGPAHRGIRELYAGNGQAIARLALPAPLLSTLDQYVLHPSMMDSALQASIGLSLAESASRGGDGKAASGLSLPFAIERVDIFGQCTASMWAWVRRTPGNTVARLQKLDIDLCDEQGRVCVHIKGFSSRLFTTDSQAANSGVRLPQLAPALVHEAAAATVNVVADRVQLRNRTIDYFKALLASVLKYPIDEISSDDAMDAYGIDSMMVMELTGLLEKSFGTLSKTLFFEHHTLSELVDYFIKMHKPQLLKLFDAGSDEFDRPAPAKMPVTTATMETGERGFSASAAFSSDRPYVTAPLLPPAAPITSYGALDIAVIGLSGCYPLAKNIDAYWRNLRDGRDCITEVPSERWDWQAYFSDDRSAARRHTCKWGGFIDDIDKFDPLFFNISPGAAEYIDPQERLFLEHAWMAMEDAGYRREDLQTPLSGSINQNDMPGQVGVYAGVMYGEYQLLGIEASRNGNGPTLANFSASVANRVSYSLNLHGPSMTVDTMCSSSLTAIHLACQDLKLGRTDLALAGGVNVSVHPNKYSVLSQGQFISSNGRCESFGAGGDGYVPSEGVGVVMLKRLVDAERDGDHIYGVIKSSALNHGGKTSGYSVPNPNAQQQAVSRALREAGIDPMSIGYIEAHGTGTILGDPIEMTGLSNAFGKYGTAAQSCWIGSAKSNIGHAESAAGIAGLTKVLLQMREGQIAPSLHSATLNPNIDFPATPFKVNQQLREWPRSVIDGHAHPRAAGLSSFGAGGSNAHLIVTEYVPANRPVTPLVDGPHMIVLSAKTEQQRREYAERLLHFLRDNSDDSHRHPALQDIAYTLQVGREAMPYRLGLLADSLTMLADKLDAFLRDDFGGLHLARAKGGDSAATHHLTTLPQGYDDVLAAWVGGAAIDWSQLASRENVLPSRISLPTYPFARERYWLVAPDSMPVVQKKTPPPSSVATTLLAYPDWKTTDASRVADGTSPAGQDYAERRIFFTGKPIAIPGTICLPLHSTLTEIDSDFTDRTVQLFEQVRQSFGNKTGGRMLLQIVIDAAPTSGVAMSSSLLVALAGLLKTARMENPQMIAQLIEFDTSERSADAVTALLRQNAAMPADRHIRYRNGRRQTQRWTELTPLQQSVPSVWKHGGVYLITGGAGGLGLIFAREIVNQVHDVTLILTGRSPLDARRHAAIEALRVQGATVEYRIVDVTDPQTVSALILSIGMLNGIIHSAGIVRDNFIIKKTATELKEVLASKVAGIVNLDLATRGIDLDFIVLFSSVSGAIGNPGQADYATANAFLDVYAEYRNRLVIDGTLPVSHRPRGRTLSINWPLWEEGGMDIDSRSKEVMWDNAGLKPLQTRAGIAAFYGALEIDRDQVMVLEGDLPRLRKLMFDEEDREGHTNAAIPVGNHDNDRDFEEVAQTIDASAAIAKVVALVTDVLADMLKMPLHRIESDVAIEEYGVDSVGMMKLTAELEKHFGSLSRTLFFEYPTIDLVSAYLASFPEKLTALFQDQTPTGLKPALVSARLMMVSESAAASAPVNAMADAGTGDIAVIGMSGRFPMAPDIETFWQNLSQGRDCITEVPAQRWDHDLYFDPDKDRAGKTYCKWGGFLDGVDLFDPLFFKISPAEAELLDPQERLFLETVWNLLESSGYMGETLKRLCQSKVGVFVGAMSQQYHAFESDLVRESLVAMSSHSSIANRVSYFFNFQGPSIAIDTMCSSALVAIHMACESLFKGECKVAVAGGVNLSIHPKKYIGLSAGKMLGSHLDSTSFGDGDGYLPSEAVGAVLLKPLRQAIADGDTILATIKSTAINHSGQSNGYYVPNTSAQADLIAGNFAKAGIDARTVSCVESAANGSALGDAIEINALTAGFRVSMAAAPFPSAQQFCAIGSVKSNIGHAEAASGMSQLIKVLLQLRHQQLVPTIKATPLNPNIDFSQTPFRLQRVLAPWSRPTLALDGSNMRDYPLRATVSAFGAGGSNAHLILEEYVSAKSHADTETVAGVSQGPFLILLSAKTALQLTAMAERLLSFLAQHPACALADVAYTLQTGREAMDYRVALIAEDHAQLAQRLLSWLQGNSSDNVANMFSGDLTQDNTDVRQLVSGKSGQAVLTMMLADKDLAKLALYWVKGIKISWQDLHAGTHEIDAPHRIVLPTYPFEKSRYWLAGKAVASAQVEASSAATSAALPQAMQRSDIERYLAQCIGELLGIPDDRIAMHKSLQDYGVDSISSIKLRRVLEQNLQIIVSARDLFIHGTLASLVDYALSQTAKKNIAESDNAESSSTITKTPAQVGLSPLSEGQKGLWLLQSLTPQLSAYNVPIALHFDELKLSVLREACEWLLQRHAALRSVFREQDGVIYRTEPASAALTMTHDRVDVANAADVVDLLRQKSKQPFDLAHGPLLRVAVVSSKLENGPAYVLITVHHIVFDGASAMLLVKDLLQAYRQLLAGRTPTHAPVHSQSAYGDFVRWQQQFLDGAQAGRQRDYWIDQLAGELPVLALPYDMPRPLQSGFNGASHALTLPAELCARAKVFAQSSRLNLSVLFLGTLHLLLRRYCGEDDIVTGMATSGRPENRFDDVIGYFVNILAIRTQGSRHSAQQSAIDFLTELQLTVADALDNADYPFPTLLKELKTVRGQTASPLFQVMFAYQNFIRPADVTALPTDHDDPGAGIALTPTIEFVAGIHQEGTHDFALEVYQGVGDFMLKIDYNTDLFHPETIGRVVGHYMNLLESLLTDPTSPTAALDMLSAQERQQITVGWCGGGSALSVSLLDIIALFQRQALATPDQTALLFEGVDISYAELDERSTRFAFYLATQGVTPGNSVGVCLPRGVDMVVAMLAVWKTGAVYVPIAPDYPEQWIRHVVDDSKMTLMLTKLPVLAVPTEVKDRPVIAPDQPAYIIYTSGSTGLPRGVVISHSAISRHSQVMQDFYGLTSSDKVLQFASMNVDASLEQLLPGLLGGASIVLRPDTLWSPQVFKKTVVELGISVVDLPPAYLHELLLDAHRPAWSALKSLRLVITGGETLGPATLDLWRRYPLSECRLINAYGPTETTITSTTFDVGPHTLATAMPIGRPLPGETVYILDRWGQPVPIGISGELHIGGTGLAAGYLNQPEMSARKFIDNPLVPGSLLYKTGDAARWLDDGNIAFLGRLDHQVKIRGFRVECGEIETALEALDPVRRAVVVARPINGSLQLAAFVEVVEIDRETGWQARLKQALAQRLPEHMLPAIFIAVERMPLMPGGKVDRTTLKQTDLADAGAGSGHDRPPAAPLTDTEIALVRIWRQVLQCEEVGIYDDFFDLGGHSLLSLRLMSEIHKQLGRELPLASLFNAPNIAAQAALVEEHSAAGWSPLVSLQTEGEATPWFCVHAVAGNVLCYRDLARHLGKRRPLYGLQAPDCEEVAHPGTIEGLAAIYLGAIRNIQAHGPYNLAGWSMGGVVAFEMAQQLQRAGEQVRTLSLIESYTPERLQAFEASSDPHDETALLAAFKREPGMDAADVDVVQQQKLFRIFKANAQAMQRYEPTSYAAGEGGIALFHGDEGDAESGWQLYLDGDVVIPRIIPGDHYSIFHAPHVSLLADELSAYIDEGIIS
ncbi:amino acid adenylation domain-containing protein [Glaciimonas sp. GNP009]